MGFFDDDIQDLIYRALFLSQFTSGTDSSKAASPSKGDCYSATDTNKVYFCFSDGAWTELAGAAVHLSQVSSGNDSSKAASPAKGDIYYASDTGRIYFCFVASAWVTVKPKIATGNDGSKDATPSVGDQYYATDTEKNYECYSAGTWAEVGAMQLPSTQPLAAATTNLNTYTDVVDVTGKGSLHAIKCVAPAAGSLLKITIDGTLIQTNIAVSNGTFYMDDFEVMQTTPFDLDWEFNASLLIEHHSVNAGSDTTTTVRYSLM